ncbi:DNA-processing protein DprA [Cryobacterium sp. TMT1-21]|uniref:DNA-processing protein DprA n=2 Tax=Microbacteriaceae TaxID=85023 RepID=A0AAQ2C8S5_9MICO|nr:DNA-processing protein DprA [Cryobacterium shii]TFD10894.1 DNA-processing protein DprA [Cryobacterium sp. TMT1-21]TFD16564.1 DNA-processing protein DprA [Cryobacterium sp. TMT2-23]TFD20524.1 DNA-processing protein DprA [Cryobacterium sp. TMT4-10]TFD35244.1 DNA-processing protein DprA [Cryobacterium sp. TMT2-10]
MSWPTAATDAPTDAAAHVPEDGAAQAAAAHAVADATEAADVFARAAWTGIAEPGDGAAGLLVQALGAAPALTAVLDLWTPARLAAVVAESGAVDEARAEGADDLAALLDQGLQRWRPRLSSGEVIRSLHQAARASTRLLLPGDVLWPVGVDDLGLHAPLALWWRGIPGALLALSNSIALVGARAASGYGEHVAMEASAGLVDRGFAIVSGAAYGIDGMAHRAALASSGVTVAFLAGGADRYYPSGHDELLGRIATQGAVISELPCGSAPTKWRFLQRNRLIAASSAATVVLEAGWRSGSLNTAGHASALGRPLGAVPGPVTSPTSAGCHRLIREYDAVCVTNAAEMAELVGERMLQLTLDLPADEGGTAGFGGRTSEQIRVFDALSSRSPRTVNDIARRAGLSAAAVQGSLGALDLEGAVRERETGWVRAG